MAHQLSVQAAADRGGEGRLRVRGPSLVRTHPETGRKSLFIGDISAGTVVGMPVDEGDALLRELRDFATQPRFTYVHRWAVGDAIIWDNRSTVHAATEFDADKHERLMHRTTIMDDTVPY